MLGKGTLRHSLFFRIFILFGIGAGLSLLIGLVAGRILYTTDERPRTLIQKYVLGVHSFLLQEIPSQPTQNDLRQFTFRHPGIEVAVWKKTALLYSSLSDSVDPMMFDSPKTVIDGATRIIHLNHRAYAMSEKEGYVYIFSHDFQPARRIIAKTFIMLILVTIGVFFLVYRFVSGELAPINDLLKGTQEIGLGNYKFKINEAHSEEFNRLVRSFNAMGEKLETTFLNNTLLIGNLSHDLKSYITRLKMTTEVEVTDERVKATLTEDINSLTAYVERTLDAFKISSRKAALQFEVVPIKEFLLDLVNQKMALDAGKNISMNFPETSFRLLLDPHFFKIMILNLLDNAFSYGDKVSLSLVIEGNGFFIELKNSMKFPIDPADFSLLSQPFFRPEKSRSVSAHHSGLGLYISRQICEAHHFDFSLHSDGDVFAVRINGQIDSPDDSGNSA